MAAKSGFSLSNSVGLYQKNTLVSRSISWASSTNRNINKRYRYSNVSLSTVLKVYALSEHCFQQWPGSWVFGVWSAIRVPCDSIKNLREMWTKRYFFCKGRDFSKSQYMFWPLAGHTNTSIANFFPFNDSSCLSIKRGGGKEGKETFLVKMYW